VNRKEYARQHYEKNRAIYIERVKRGKVKSMLRNRKYLLQFLLKHPCVDCGESNPILLEFDHRKTEEKVGNIADMSRNGVSLSRLKSEVSKCEIRCANCHRLKTAREENWWIYRAAEEPGSSPVS